MKSSTITPNINSVSAQVRTAANLEQAEQALELAMQLIPDGFPDAEAVRASLPSFRASSPDTEQADEDFEARSIEPDQIDQAIHECANDPEMTEDERVLRLSHLNARRQAWPMTHRQSYLAAQRARESFYASQLEALSAVPPTIAAYAVAAEAAEKVARFRLGQWRNVVGQASSSRQACTDALSKVRAEIAKRTRNVNPAYAPLQELARQANRNMRGARQQEIEKAESFESTGFVLRAGRALTPVPLDSDGQPLHPDSVEGQAFIKASARSAAGENAAARTAARQRDEDAARKEALAEKAGQDAYHAARREGKKDTVALEAFRFAKEKALKH